MEPFDIWRPRDENYEYNFKEWRKLKLAESDWMLLSDTPTISDAWMTYRQALRDLPASADYPDNLYVSDFVPLDPEGN